MPRTMDLNEAKTRASQINPQLESAGWNLSDHAQVRLEVPVTGYDPNPMQTREEAPAKEITSLPLPDSAGSIPNLYGVVLVAPCDFSKASRDVLQQWCSQHGVSEWHVWGEAELEDMLFQPKNDHLLFAYFGISLQIRKRSIRTEVRSLITIKRKLKRALEKRGFNLSVLLRDPTDSRYPFSDRSKAADQRDHRWRVYQELGLNFRGLKLSGPNCWSSLARYQLLCGFSWLSPSRSSLID